MDRNVQKEFFNDDLSRSQIEHDDRLSIFIKEISNLENFRQLRVLDYGCGNCFFSSYLKNILGVKNVFATDIFDEVKSYAEESDIGFIPLKNITQFEFDVIILGEVVEHVVDLDDFMDLMRKICKKNGRVIISTPNLASWFNRVLLFWGIVPIYYQYSSRFVDLGHRKIAKITNTNGNYGHVRMFTFNALKDFLEFNEFKVVRSYGTTVLKNRFFRNFDKSLSFLFPSLAHDLVFVVQKQ